MNFLTEGANKISKDFKLVGRENDLARISAILMRADANSVLLTGPGGVGCSALCYGLQEMKSHPDAPFDIISKRFLWLDVDRLFSSDEIKELEANFHKLCAFLKRTPESVLIIEDARDFIEAARNNGVTHFINTLNSLIKQKKTQIILEVRDDDLEFVLRSHSDMIECYTLMDLEEPTNGDLPIIIESASKSLVDHHGIKIDPDAQISSIEITSSHRTKDMGLSRAQPERTLTLLDRALATKRLNSHKNHPPIIRSLSQSQIEMEEKLLNWEEDLSDLLKEEEEKRNKSGIGSTEPTRVVAFGNVASGFNPVIAEKQNNIKVAKEELQKNYEQYDTLIKEINDKLTLTKSDILREFSAISGISVDKLNEDESEKLRNLEENMLTRIFGQNEAVKRLCDAVKVSRISKKKSKAPVSFLFKGPSGVGKSEIGMALAHFLMDDEEALTRFDMSEYAEKHAVARLIGAPPGYEGFEAGGILTNLMRKNPSRYLLFDEIEKAHPDIFNVFLQILDAGRLTDGLGRTVSFKNSIIIMTSNIGQAHYLNSELTEEEAEAKATEDLNATYRSEFLNRFAGRQNIVTFKKLGVENIQKIVAREIQNISSSYVDDGIQIKMEPDQIAAFCKDRYDPAVGARGLPGFLTATFEPLVANTILYRPGVHGTFLVKYNVTKRKFETELVENVNGSAS